MPLVVAPQGRVVGLHIKGRTPGEMGMPKHAIDSVRVTPLGADGDYNVYRQEKMKGDPGSALLLMTDEALHTLRTEGWPIERGHLGENVTTEGIAYADFAPGTRWRIGDAEVRIDRACDPCKNLYHLTYVGSQRGPEFLKTMHGRRGWYARVERPATIHVGDQISRIE